MPDAKQPPIAVPDHEAVLPVWPAPLVAIPFAILLTVVAGATEIPCDYLTGRAFLGAVLLGLGDLPGLLWSPLAFCGLTAAILLVRPSSRQGRLIRLGALPLPALLACLHACLGLRVDPALAARPWLALLFAGLAVVLSAWAIDLARQGRPGAGPSRPLRLASAAAGPALVAAAAGAHLANRRLLEDGYPAWHLGLSRAGFLLLAAGLASLAVRHGVVRRLRARPRSAVAIGLAVAVALAAPAALPVREMVPFRYLPRYLRHTTLGASALFVSGAARSARRRGSSPSVADPDGEETFARLSNLPPLPEGFELRHHNLLLVSMEAMRFGDTSLAAPPTGLTPNLERFASLDGTLSFARAFSPAPATIQVFSSMFCMAPVSFTPVRLWSKWYGHLPGRARTVAEILAEEGWWTFYAGHNHKRHFAPGGRIGGLHQGFAEKTFVSPPRGQKAFVDADERIAAAAVGALREAAGYGAPFFGWVFLSSTHEPWFERYPEMPGATRHELYLQQVRHIDEKLGVVLDGLREAGLLERTVVIVHGDHGEAFKEHGIYGHSGVYPEVLHVPLVVRVPGLGGGAVAGPVSTAYVFPWLLARGRGAARAEALAAMRNRFGPAMKGTGGAVVAEQLSTEGLRTALAAGNGWLIHCHPSETVEIYDTRRDKRLERDVSETGKPLAKDMAGRLRGWLEVQEAAGVPLAEHLVEAPKRRKR